MKKWFIVSLLVIQITSQVAAQVNLREGYVVMPSNDTLRGEVVYKESALRFSECNFKPAGGETKVFLPDELAAYGFVKGKSYVSRKLPVTSAQGPVFAEIFVNGKASLLSWNDRLFLEMDHQKIYELEEVKEQIVKDGAPYVNTIKKYKGVLSAQLTGCAESSKKIPYLSFDTPSIGKALRVYNKCFGETDHEVRNKRKWLQVTPGLSMGYSSSNISELENSVLNGYVDPNQFGKDQIFYPGLSLEFSSPATSERLALHFDVLFQNNSLESTRELSTVYQTITWNSSSVHLPMSFVYYFLPLGKRAQLFAEVGASMNLKSTSSITYRNVYKVDQSVDEGTANLPITDESDFLIFGGLGVQVNVGSRFVWTTKFRYETGQFAISGDINGGSGNISVLTGLTSLGYRVFK